MKNAIITIDTEAPAGTNPIDSLIYGKIPNGKEYGIGALMSMLDEHDYKGLFFVDIAEAWDNGEKAIAEVIDVIKTKGHDVGVHIHPDHMEDRERRFLWQYSYDEQLKIIEQCTDFYMRITGEMPKSFRAGRYGANDDTVKILDRLGYKYDFSEFPYNKRCKISFDGLYNQKKIMRNTNITEIPVSVFQSFKTPFYNRMDKIDVTQSLSEFKSVINLFEENQIIVFFMHSFSLLNWRNNPDKPVFSRKKYEKIDKMLTYLRNNEINVVDESELALLTFDWKNGFVSIAKSPNQYYYFAKRAFVTLLEKTQLNV